MTSNQSFDDAIAIFHMAKNAESFGRGRLVSHGHVELGIELDGEERQGSLARGGDGCVARFDGGHLEVAPTTDSNDMAGNEMTLCVRMRDPAGSWQAPIFGSYGGEASVSFYLEGTDGAEKVFATQRSHQYRHHTVYSDLFGTPGGPLAVTGSSSLVEFTWGTKPRSDIVNQLQQSGCGEPLLSEARNGVMKVNFPVAHINPMAWHDVIVRHTGTILELFIDGVLVDEEFPIGKTRPSTAPVLIGAAATPDGLRTGFHGFVDHVALWDRALTKEEIVTLSGGANMVQHRDRQILGTTGDRLQYWRPRGHNSRAGDCMPFFHDGVFHLYYLVVRRNHHGKWQNGHGGLQIWHASSRDLVHWRHHPTAVPISAQWQSWWGTGGFAVHNGTYFTYQKGPSMLPEGPNGGVQLATSSDGVHFTPQPPFPYLPGYDCDIFVERHSETYHLLTTEGTDDEDNIAILRWTSSDLRNWERADEPVLVTKQKEFNINICPHLFQWNDWYYLFAGFDRLGGVWMSRSPFGPWKQHTPVRLDLPTVPKTAPFPLNRRIYTGFLGDRGWGGNIVFRELVQHEDGSLGTRFPPEMVPPSGAQVNPIFLPLTPSASGDAANVKLEVDGSKPQVAELGRIPANAHIRFTLQPEATLPPTACFGICVRATARTLPNALLHAGTLEFHPHQQRVSLSTTHILASGGVSKAVITDVTGIERQFTVEVIVNHDIVDVCIDGCRTVIGRCWNPSDDRLQFFAKNCTVSFCDIEVHPIEPLS